MTIVPHTIDTQILAGAVALLLVLFVYMVATSRRGAKPTVEDLKRVEIGQPTAERLEHDLEEAYRQQIVDSTATFSKDLTATSQSLSKQVERLTTEVMTKELDEYAETLEQVRSIATGAAGQMQAAIAEQQADLRATMEKALAREQDRRLAQIDAKLADIISGYLVEALGSTVDLGAQTSYILASMEEHKEDIRRDLSGGV